MTHKPKQKKTVGGLFVSSMFAKHTSKPADNNEQITKIFNPDVDKVGYNFSLKSFFEQKIQAKHKR
jgi:hypothetical protein